MKIVIIGAGSGFGGVLATDILAREKMRGVHIALCDIVADRVEKTRDHMNGLIEEHRLEGRCTAHIDHVEALPGADIVITSVSVGGPSYWGEPFKSEIEIPRKYGLDQFIGDTLGPGGVFRFLRTAPVHLQFCKDMEQHCPEALMLNYTNPMAMLTWLHSRGSSICNVGLCHSIQGTTKLLAKVAGVPYEEVSYLVAGINHLAWVLRLQHGETDLLPRILEVADTHEALAQDRVRVEIMKQFGYFPTESSKHNSEYMPYFRRTAAEMEEFALMPPRVVPLEWDAPRVWAKDSGLDEKAKGPGLKTSHEYASSIAETWLTGGNFVFNGNVMNGGCISNLPAESCVEVPISVGYRALLPCQVGALPAQCAALDQTNITMQELAVRAFLERDREMAFHAVALDPLTAAIMPLSKIRSMFDELWEVEKPLLGTEPWRN